MPQNETNALVPKSTTGRGPDSMKSIEQAQAKCLEQITDAFGLDGEFWPNFVQVAVMLTAHFSNSFISIDKNRGPLTFTLFHGAELIATIDEVRIRFTDDLRDQDWAGIYEGDVFTVTTDYLENFSRLGYKIYQPKKTYKFGKPIRHKKLLVPN